MRRKLDIERLRKIADSINEGKSYKATAEELGISVGAINYWIKRMKTAHVQLNITRGPKPMNLKELCQ